MVNKRKKKKDPNKNAIEMDYIIVQHHFSNVGGRYQNVLVL